MRGKAVAQQMWTQGLSADHAMQIALDYALHRAPTQASTAAVEKERADFHLRNVHLQQQFCPALHIGFESDKGQAANGCDALLVPFIGQPENAFF